MADVNVAADVSKINAAEDADEDEKLEYTSTKEDTVFNAYVTIATVYAAGEEPQSWRDQEPRFPCRLEEALTEVSSLGLTTGPSNKLEQGCNFWPMHFLTVTTQSGLT